MRETQRQTHFSQKTLAYLDDLTGIYNRRYLKITEKQIAALVTKSIPFSVAIADIDHFKEINDTHGHIRGDEVIKEFAKFLKENLRSTDTIVRYGGDEFVCIMLNAEQKDTHQIFVRLMDRCKKQRLGGVDVMISVGIASYPADGKDFNTLLHIADESLYDAKRSGRGRIGTIQKKLIQLPTDVFVGRKNEKEALSAFLTELDGAIGAAAVEGNVGIGKTRLVKEVLNTISGREILWSDCLAFFEAIPYYPIREIIKYKMERQGHRIIEDIPLAYRVEIGKLIPEIMEEVRGRVNEIGLVLDKYRLYESIRRIIEIGNKKKIIVIDNMQWSDRESTESIQYLLRALQDYPIRFLFLYRQEEKTLALENFTSSISRDVNVRKIFLNSLGAEEIKEMLNLILGESPSDELLEYIKQESGGNPLYIEEVIKGLGDAGYLKLEIDRWQFEKPKAQVIPKTVEDITERKYQSLGKEHKEILEIASTVGWFDVDILKIITGYNEGHIIGVLDKIKRAGLVREHGERIEFQDELSRNTIYQKNVAGIKGRMLHKKIGEILEERHKGKEQEIIEELAYHFYLGGDKDKGVHYSIEAGDRTREKYANNSALRYYTWAEELLRNERTSETRAIWIDCLIKRASVFMFTGDNESALKDLETALAVAREIGDRKREAEISTRKISIYINVFQHIKAIAEARDCLEIYEQLDDKLGIARLLSAIGNARGFLGEHKKAFKNYKDALRKCREAGDKHFEARILNNIGLAYMNLGDDMRALQYYQEASKLKDQTRDKYLEGAVLNNIGLINMNSLEYSKALKNYSDSLKIFKEIGNRYGEALVLNNIGIIYENWGEYTKGLKFSEDSLKIANVTENKYCETLALNNIGTIYMDVGDYDRARRYLNDALNLAENMKSHDQLFNNLIPIGYLYLLERNIEKARVSLEKAADTAKDLKSPRKSREALLALGNLYLEAKEYENLEKTTAALDELPKELKSKMFEGKMNVLLGRYQTETKNFKRASECFDAALNIFEDLENKLEIGKVYYFLGLLEYRKGSKSFYQRHLKKASEIFNSIGAKAWKEKAKEASQSSD